MIINNVERQNNKTIQVLWVALGNFSSFILAILSTAILSRYFSKADYGTYREIVYVYSALLVIFTAGLPTVYSYFLPRFNLQQGKDIVWKISKFLFFAGVVFSIFLFSFSDLIAKFLKNPELSRALKIFAPVPMLLLPTLGIEGIFSTYRKTYYIAIYEIITRIIALIFITIPVIIFHGSYIQSIFGWNIASLFSFILAWYFKNIPFVGVKAEKSNLSIKKIFGYSFPLVTASIWGMAIKASDQFYISRYFGAVIFAEFSNGFIEIPLVSMVTSATATVLLPVFSRMFFEKSEPDDFITIWKNALLKSAIIIYPMVIFFIFNAKNIISILYSTKYLNSIIYFQIAMVLNFFNIIIFAPLILALGKTKFYSKLHMFIAFGAWSLGYVTVITFNSPLAIAILSVSLSIIKVIIAFIFISRTINVRIFKLIPMKEIANYTILSIIIITIIRLSLTLMLPHLNPIIDLSVTFISYSLILLVATKSFELNYISILQPIFAKFPRKY